MKKIVFASLVASSALLAGDFFVGVDVGSANFKGTVTASGGAISSSADDDTTGGTQALKVGYYLNDNNRLYASIHRFNEESNVDVSWYKVSYDYLIGNGALKPYVGVNVGNFSYKVSGMNAYLNKDSLETSGMSYGVQAGLNYKISKNFDAELSYTYSKANGDDSATLRKNPAITVKLEADKVSSWQIGLNYRF